VLLHFGTDNLYPILDYRALWSLGFDRSPAYNVPLWLSYVHFCRTESARLTVSLRVLDRALWQFSKENQPSR
jgi:hypothetical protein